MLTIPQYRGLIDKVPELPDPLDLRTLDSYEASLYIGDYAPSGRIVPIKTFLESPQSIFEY